MLTRLCIRNFKLFGEVEIELGERVVFVGPNLSGQKRGQFLILTHEVARGILAAWLAS